MQKKKITTRKRGMFICEKDCEKYHHYRQQVIDCRQEKLKEQQKREEAEKEIEKRTNSGASKKPICSVEEDKYDPESVISADNDSDDEYRRGMMDRNRDNIKRRIECRNELSEEERQEREAEERDAQRKLEKKKLRKSRWGGKVENANSSASTSSVPSNFGNQNKPLLTAITRNDPALLQYAKLNYGSTNLSEEDWKKCEEHYKVNLLYQDMMRKRQEIDRLARSGKFKYEYDSDEDVDGGTWEHKLRQAEMEATRAWATALTKQSEGKHHIGDFLPPEELKKFMEQYEAKKSNRQPDLSDYKEYKLKEDNKGFQMLQKLGWKEGQGLGQDGEGIVDPINKGPQREGNQGLGVQNAASPEECDNEYDAYRKRMMLAYRFRPNPLVDGFSEVDIVKSLMNISEYYEWRKKLTTIYFVGQARHTFENNGLKEVAGDILGIGAGWGIVEVEFGLSKAAKFKLESTCSKSAAALLGGIRRFAKPFALGVNLPKPLVLIKALTPSSIVKPSMIFSFTSFTYLLTLLNLHGNCEPTIVPFTKSSILPDASRTAAPPANMTNMAYEIMDKSKAQKVPFGIASPGSFRSPQILAPA
uniref:G-patch domain-containing protein n=1 Tax=Glossina pallidipes TaxID=7398 RepID=A0A1A9Z8H5_GLOPL